MPQGPPDPRQLGVYVAISQVGLEMVAPIVGGIALDHYLGWSPWGIICGAVLGLVGGLAHLIAILNRAEDKSDPEGKRSDRGGRS